MSSKKSDTPIAASSARSTGWRDFIISNAPLPLLLAAMLPLGYLVERSGYVDSYYTRMITLIGYNIILAVSLQLINGFSGQFSLGHAGFMAVGAYLAAYPAINHSSLGADGAPYTNPAALLLFFIALAVVVGIVSGVVFGLFAACRQSRRIHRSLPAVLTLLLIAWLMIDLAKSARYETPPPYLIWSRGINWVSSAMTAMLAHGQPLAARISAALPIATRQPLSCFVLLLGAGCCAAAAGLIVGLPALRLRGDYLAIATLGLGEIIRIIIINTPALGGALGLTPIPRAVDFTWLYGTVIITVFFIWRVAYSATGRAIMAVREDEIAAASIGISNTYYKVMAFVIGAFFAGVAGALFALGQYSITPTRFSMDRSIEIVVMVTLGGLGSISGAILAAVLLTLLPEVLRPIAEYRMVIYSLALVIMMLLRPQGLLGGRELWPRRFKSGRLPAPTEEPRQAVPA
jgi:ABC-type branched-subunit amino acid transport system permease subunit